MASRHHSPIFEAIQNNASDRTAIVHSLSGRSFTYNSLISDVATSKEYLSKQTGDLNGRSIAFLIENSYEYVVSLLAILASNARAVPLAPSFPASELRYILNHSGSDALLCSGKFESLASNVLDSNDLDQKPNLIKVEKLDAASTTTNRLEFEDHTADGESGLMLYTSGTTARPKGVLLHQDVLLAQSLSLLKAWEYSAEDRLLHVLPLHHIHGTVNALIAPLIAGSSIEFMFPFNADQVWKRLASPFLPHDGSDQKQAPITFFTAVPTVWSRLLRSQPELSTDLQDASKVGIQRKNLRLNISGSAALPVPTKQSWTSLSSGNTLLERYGMTEVGMALSCGLADSDRIDGSVGWALPFVEARLVNPDTNEIIPTGEDKDVDGKEIPGEIQLRGPTIFKGYWRDPVATEKEFTSDGWFKTGDIAVRRDVSSSGSGSGASGTWARGPAYFILGRASADIIKTGGEKVSALEIEREILSLPSIAECAVVALPSETWEEKIAAIVTLTEEGKTAGKGGKQFGAMDLRRALKGRLVNYKIPQDLEVVEVIPRNAMGKVNKKELVADIFGDGKAIRRRSIEVAAEREEMKRYGER